MAKDEKLEQLLEKVDEIKTITRKSDDSIEVSFKGGLVFENMAIPKNDEPSLEESEPVGEESISADDEFTLPDTFEIDEKYNTPATPDTPTAIFRPYVPTFTGIGDKYRMKDDPRPRPKEEPKPAVIKAEVSECESVDPIAELEVEHEDVVTVNINGKEDTSSNNLNVFKFAESVSMAMGKKPERTVEDERREINELITPKKEEQPIEAPVVEPDPIPEPEPEPEPREQVKKSYSIPDPTDDIRVIDYGKSSRETPKYKRVAPEGASDEIPKPQKRKLGQAEFNSQAERDEFKDAFLDSTLSIKIRLVAMAAIMLVMAVFENIIVTPDGNRLGEIGILPELYSAIDLLFVTATLIIAIPEIVRAFRYLTYGRVIPELFLAIAYIVELVYASIVTANQAENAPLYGMLFSVLSFVTVLSAHYRVNADFVAFKVASQNTEKQVLDRKLTRTLHDENMALDGAIDEYKSRTARIFHAAFISDFFKRTSKVSENTLASVLPLIISFGAATLTGFVAFFLNGGIIAAASGFTLVFLLSLPAFSVLVHKLPYFDAQQVALDENSTLVGETSYRSFSTVDVLAFDDTDIFGVEDINLRRVILYGDQSNPERPMRLLSSLFASVGGPLHLIFRKMIDRKCQPATNVTIESDGICGTVEGVRVCAGSEEYMLRHNIAIPELNNKRDTGVDTTRIMYAAENGEVYAKFYIRYSFSEQFAMLLPEIREEEIVPLIYTRDPNLSNDLLKTLCAGSDSMRVMKRYDPISPEDSKIYGRVSAEFVTCGNTINTINTVLLTKKYSKFAQQLSGTELYATVITAAISAILSVFGVTSIPVIVFSLWQIAWCAVLRIASKRAFPKTPIDEDNS